MDYETLKSVRVLLVDDDEDDYIIMRNLIAQIQDSPFNLQWVSNFDEARETIEAQKHDVYLIDYRLGERTGLDLLQIVRPVKRAEPFILLTGAGDREVEWRSMKLAAADYLVKGSFNADMLARTLYYAIQRKQIEEQRIQHYIELNRSKDEFISIASHQLRTPATGVKQYVGMLLEGFAGEVTESQQAMLEKAYESNERQLRIVSDLLKVAQVDAGKVMFKKEAVALNDLVQDVIREQKDTFAKRKQTLEYLPATDSPEAIVDHDTIRMVIENIIDNASKYSQDGKTITVRTRETLKYACVDVVDEGVGISKHDRSKLFEKFSRINNPLSTKVGGTGLGLYWAKKIVDLHDGSITVKSVQGTGATFTICLPKQLV